MSDPSICQLGAAKRIFRYLKGTVDHGLRFDGTKWDSMGFGWLLGRRLGGGYRGAQIDVWIRVSVRWWYDQLVQQAPVGGGSLRLRRSTYVAMSAAASETIWLRRLIGYLGHSQKAETKLYVDNMPALSLAKNPVFHERTKHIGVQVHYIWECIKNHSMVLQHVGTVEMTADVLTASLGSTKFLKFRSDMLVEQVGT